MKFRTSNANGVHTGQVLLVSETAAHPIVGVRHCYSRWLARWDTVEVLYETPGKIRSKRYRARAKVWVSDR